MCIMHRGVHPPWGNDAFPLFSVFPLFPRNFSVCFSVENFPDLAFSGKISDFHPPKFLMTFFLVIDYKFVISPLFSLFKSVSRYFEENFHFPPTFAHFPPDFIKFPRFLHTFCEFRLPLLWPWCIYASHNARTGRPWLCMMVTGDRSFSRLKLIKGFAAQNDSCSLWTGFHSCALNI